MITLSRRRLAFIAVAAALALGLGFLAARVFGPGRPHPVAPVTSAAAPPAAAPATTPPGASAPPATTTPPAVSSTTPPAATVPPSSPAPGIAGRGATAAHQVLPTSLPSVTFTDARARLRISYPRTWTRAPTNDPTRPLLVLSHDGASLLIRAVQLSHPIDGPRLAVLRDATLNFIRARHAVKVIAGPRLLASSDLPGYLYIYSFYDPISRVRVAHSQITLFAGRRMYTLIFQVAREVELTRFALLFDKITASFRAT